MAKLTWYQQQTDPRVGVPGASMRPVRVDTGIPELLGGITQAAGAVNKSREDEAAIGASALAIEARKQWIAEVQAREQAALDAGQFDDHIPKIEEDFRKFSDEHVAKAKTPAAQAWLRERMGSLGLDLFERGTAFTATAKVEHNINTARTSLESGRVVVDLDPSQYDAVRSDVMLQYLPLPEHKRAEVWQRDGQELAFAAGVGAVRKDPKAVLEALDADPERSGVTFIDHLDADGRLRLRQSAETEINQREAQARAVAAEQREKLGYLMQDQMAMALDGIAVNDPISPARAKAAGLDAERYRDYRETLSVAPKMAKLGGMPVSEMGAYLASLDPGEAGAEGYATRAKMRDVVAQQAGQIVKAREDSPGDYLVRTDVAVRDAYNALGTQRPPEDAKAAAANYAQAVRSRAKALGIQNPNILPKGYADQVVGTFYQQATSGPTQAPAIIGERMRWGDDWPTVFRQLAPSLPGTAYVIGKGMRDEPATRLMRATYDVATGKPLSIDDINKSLPGGVTPKDLRDSVNSGLADYLQSIAGQPGAEQEATTMSEAAYRLAATYMRENKGASAAGNQAAAEVIGERFVFVGVDDSVLRLPTRLPGGLGHSDVRRLLDMTHRKEAAAAAVDMNFADARWQTTPDSNGIALVYNGDAVPRADGSAIEFTWAQLANMKATRDETEREIDRDSLENRGYK